MKIYVVSYQQQLSGHSFPFTFIGGVYTEEKMKALSEKYPNWFNSPKVSVIEREIDSDNFLSNIASFDAVEKAINLANEGVA